MNSLLSYLLQVIAISGILYLYYHVALRNKKFHLYNRFYLLGAIIASILIPFLNIPVYLTPQEAESSLVLQTLSTFYQPGTGEIVFPAIETNTIPVKKTDPANYFYYGYVLLSLVVLTRIIFSLLKIRRLSKTYPIEKIGDINFVNTQEPGTPFSFFRWLFWNQRIELNSDKGEQVFRHELYHIRQRHSVDIIIAELATVVFWINPFFHIIKKEIRAIHEFLADRFAITETSEWDYAELLLMQALQTKQRLVHPFFQTQIKRRIAMITNPQKTSYRYLRKLLVLPLAAIVISAFAFKYKNARHYHVVPATEAITVVIDAGHGGGDPGANSPGGVYSESKLALQLAHKINELAGEYNVNVVMTRTDDALPGNAVTKQEGLRNRVNIAARTNPAAFISLHLNVTGANNFQERFSGMNAYIATNRKDGADKKLAVSILSELAGIYKTTTDPYTRNDGGVWVLDRNTCPAVLIECGFINNKEDLSFITNPANQEKVARAILKGIVRSAEQKDLANMVPVDTIPQFTISGKISEIAPGFTITVEDLVIKDVIHEYKEAPGLVIINGKKLSFDDARKRFNGATVTKAEMTTIAPGDDAAIQQYGEAARKGVIIISNGVFTKHEVEFIPGGINITDSFGTIKALIVIDNIPSDKNNQETLATISPDSIESINVLKPPTSTNKYGERGRDGAIEIFTKKGNGLITQGMVIDTAKAGDPNILSGEAYDEFPLNNGGARSLFHPNNVDIPPAYPGGQEAWKQYIAQHLDMSIPASFKAPPGQYTVAVEFVVTERGAVTEVRPLSKPGYGMEREAVRLIEKGPSWKPAVKDGHIVPAFKIVGITFHVPGQVVKEPSRLNPLQVEGYYFREEATRRLITAQQQRRQDLKEIKDIAKNDSKIAYTYKGRTYLFFNNNGSGYFETDGVNHRFLINDVIYESTYKINEQLKRNEVYDVKLVKDSVFRTETPAVLYPSGKYFN